MGQEGAVSTKVEKGRPLTSPGFCQNSKEQKRKKEGLHKKGSRGALAKCQAEEAAHSPLLLSEEEVAQELGLQKQKPWH